MKENHDVKYSGSGWIFVIVVSFSYYVIYQQATVAVVLQLRRFHMSIQSVTTLLLHNIAFLSFHLMNFIAITRLFCHYNIAWFHPSVHPIKRVNDEKESRLKSNLYQTSNKVLMIRYIYHCRILILLNVSSNCLNSNMFLSASLEPS